MFYRELLAEKTLLNAGFLSVQSLIRWKHNQSNGSILFAVTLFIHENAFPLQFITADLNRFAPKLGSFT